MADSGPQSHCSTSIELRAFSQSDISESRNTCRQSSPETAGDLFHCGFPIPDERSQTFPLTDIIGSQVVASPRLDCIVENGLKIIRGKHPVAFSRTLNSRFNRPRVSMDQTIDPMTPTCLNRSGNR